MDLLKLFLPFISVVTFIAGYLLSNLDRLRESRRKRRNMKMILFKEMSENYKLLNTLVPLDKEKLPDPTLVGMMTQRFSFAVYDRYLDRLDQLRTKELSKIYEACVMLKGLQSDGNAFLNAATDASQSRHVVRARATILVLTISKCRELQAQALLVLPGGSSFLRAEETARGSILTAYEEASAFVDKLAL